MAFYICGKSPEQIDKLCQIMYNAYDMAKRRCNAVSTLLPKGGVCYANYFNFSFRCFHLYDTY